MKKILLLLTLISVITISCANEDGDKVECPTCDNVTELLVGAKCVAIEEISVCGPDGHAHGEECHCFSNQEVTEINGKQYCLQNACAEELECNGYGELVEGTCQCEEGYVVDEVDSTKCMPLDLDDLACDNIDMNVTEIHDATDGFNGGHIEVEEKISINLISDKESYVHFPTSESTTFAVYVDKADLLLGVYSKNGDVEFEIETLGENEDCTNKIKAVYHITTQRQLPDESMEPVVLKFDKFDGSISVFIHEVHGEHTEHK